MVLETVATLTHNGEGVDIVCSAWKHAAVRYKGIRTEKSVATFLEHKVQASLF